MPFDNYTAFLTETAKKRQSSSFLCDFWLSDLVEGMRLLLVFGLHSIRLMDSLGGRKVGRGSDILHDGTKYYTCTKILKTNAKSFLHNEQGFIFKILYNRYE